jgi:16S rRNA (cytosine1402-N4)-methyltransferase
VNGELDALPGALDTAMERTQPGGRVAVLSYHSGEDRIVKDRMREAVTGGCPCPPELPCVCDAVQTVRLVRGVAKTPSAAEQAGNRRASSARLRVVERISDSPTRGRR